jgi:hypothetical protein
MNIAGYQRDARETWNETNRRVFRVQHRITAMLPALATLAFLATLWMIVMVAARMADENGSKIVAAFKGQSQLAAERQLAQAPVRVSQRARQQRIVRAQPRLRAAA